VFREDEDPVSEELEDVRDVCLDEECKDSLIGVLKLPGFLRRFICRSFGGDSKRGWSFPREIRGFQFFRELK
jgi:hypothetical protein